MMDETARHYKAVMSGKRSKEAVERGYGCQCAEKARKEEQAKQPIPGQRSIFDFLSEEDDENDERKGTEK